MVGHFSRVDVAIESLDRRKTLLPKFFIRHQLDGISHLIYWW
jgi:hypothetical protein